VVSVQIPRPRFVGDRMFAWGLFIEEDEPVAKAGSDVDSSTPASPRTNGTTGTTGAFDYISGDSTLAAAG
ncbi:unnamed protein product, partial [Amoebophrya sp. A25]